jgi:hypothetical protein
VATKQPSGPTYRDELAIAHHFAEVLEQRLAGRNQLRRTNVHPLDWCHLGVLGPVKAEPAALELEVEQPEGQEPANGANEPPAAAASAENSENKAPQAATNHVAEDEDVVAKPADRADDFAATRRPPSALGFEILANPNDSGVVELVVNASFCLFTKHLPSWKEQTEVLGPNSGASEGLPVAEVVQRWPLAVDGIRFQLRATGEHSQDDKGAVQGIVDAAMLSAFSRADAGRKWPGPRPKVNNVVYLKDDQTFDQFLNSITSGCPIDQWRILAKIEVRVWPRADGKLRIGCYLRNATPAMGIGYQDAYLVVGDAVVKATLTQGTLHPIEILPVPQDYQFDRRIWAVGHSASVRISQDHQRLETHALAMHEQMRIVTRNVPPTKFLELTKDPLATLDKIYAAMGDYATDWKTRVIDANALKFDTTELKECAKDLVGFRNEMDRFAAGVAALLADPRLLRAFKAMNVVFGRLATDYESWHLFQLVFIVTQMPALAIRENIAAGEYPEGTSHNWSDILDWGDVIWFRTGGGKTEAYLGLACCAILYDRLRGKKQGITAWLRFPLRMLSVQQLQRAMRMVWEAEKERKALLGTQASDSDSIRLGYFVGSTTTPNILREEDLTQKYATPQSREPLRVVPDCPACGGKGTVTVEVDIKTMCFKHLCSSCKVDLPLDISDDEVYRHLPALMLGTIDKMASVGQQIKYGVLWGGAKWCCPTHGYGFGEYCFVFGCKVDKKTRTKVVPYDPAPALHIQDELHLLQEELGAFAGHYETLVRYCEKTLSTRPSKVIAATATIEGFEHQVRHIYGVKYARRFPGRGYDRLTSFYAEPATDTKGQHKTARIFVAFRSTSLHQADAAAFCTEILQTEIDRLIHNPHLALAFLKDAQTPDDVHRLLVFYTTTLNYVGTLMGGTRVTQGLEKVAEKTRQLTHREMTVEYHSSRSTGAEVANLVHRVQTPPQWNDAAFLDAVVATAMISHGVDLERFNLMVMDGIPAETAEYIQASSRSGRKHVGMVVVVLPAFSIRATSIYHRFLEYHEHIERMVSPVPVNRFAKYAARRTLPGIVMGLVYGRHAVETGNQKLKERHTADAMFQTMGRPAVLDELRGAYALGKGIYDKSLELGLDQALVEQLALVEGSIRTSQEKYLHDAIRPTPMRSLRDVEVGVPFWPDVDYTVLQVVKKVKD